MEAEEEEPREAGGREGVGEVEDFKTMGLQREWKVRGARTLGNNNS